MNFNNNNNDESLENDIITSYMEFINTTNTSLHSMLEIINNQQSDNKPSEDQPENVAYEG